MCRLVPDFFPSPPPSPPSPQGPILASRQGTYFGSSTSEPEMEFSRSLICHGSRYMWDSVPIYPSPSLSLPYLTSLFELGCLLSFQPNRAFNHERNPIAISPCSSSSALDGSCEPGRDVNGT